MSGATVSTFISTTTSVLFINSDIPYTFLLPTANDTNRMIYFKQYMASTFSKSFTILPNATDTIENAGRSFSFSTGSAVCLQTATTGNNWLFHNQFKWVNNTFSNEVPLGIPVYPSTHTISKNIFLNLTGSSKTVVLPPANSWISATYGVPIITIKDINGNAFTNPFYISTSGLDILEHSSLKGCIKITSSLASIDLIANPFSLSRDFINISSSWSILSYYDGTSNI